MGKIYVCTFIYINNKNFRHLRHPTPKKPVVMGFFGCFFGCFSGASGAFFSTKIEISWKISPKIEKIREKQAEILFCCMPFVEFDERERNKAFILWVKWNPLPLWLQIITHKAEQPVLSGGNRWQHTERTTGHPQPPLWELKGSISIITLPNC